MINEYDCGRDAKLRILEMGCRLWAANPSYVTARRIANELGMTHSNVLYHFDHSKNLVDAIAFHAVKEGDSRVITHLIAARHSAVLSMSPADKTKHFILANAQ